MSDQQYHERVNPELLYARLAAFAPGLEQLLGGLSNADARWRPARGGWSVLEIVCHLVDEESEDFRARLDATLSEPQKNWQPIDPQRAVEDRGYNERDLKRSLEAFRLERLQTINWIKGLVSPRWSTAYEHPKLGKISAGDLLLSLASHDALHMRQVARRLFDLAQRDAPGFKADYAGTWNRES